MARLFLRQIPAQTRGRYFTAVPPPLCPRCEQFPDGGQSVKALEEFQDFFSRATQTAHGIYALYRREKLYYVGLARNLRARLKNHLRDRHRDQWDRFSIYLTSSDDYIRELESLVLRIVSPPGNRVMGKFPGAANLRRKLQRYIRWQAREREQLLLGAIRRKPLPESRRKLVRPLRGKFGRNMTLRGQINGVTYSARLLTNGAIVVKRKRYNTPTEAALASVRTASGSTDGASGWSSELRVSGSGYGSCSSVRVGQSSSAPGDVRLPARRG